MGKRGSKILKNKAKEIYKRFPEKVSEEFEENKEFLKDLGIFDYSKTDRNIVAGMLCRLASEELVETETV